jgi:tRNA 2-thiouridine synthesizing protein A
MTTTVEARGVLCPVPIIRLARATAALAPGSLVALLTDDPAAEHDVPAWCRLRGHTLLSSEPLPESATVPTPGSAAHPGPEPHVPNPQPGQPVRHLIRLAGARASAGPGSAGTTGTAPSAGATTSDRPSSSR